MRHLKGMLVVLFVAAAVSASVPAQAYNSMLRIYGDGEHMVFIDLSTLQVRGNKVGFDRTDSFKKPVHLNDFLPKEFVEKYDIRDLTHPGESEPEKGIHIINVTPPGEFRCMRSHHIVDIVKKNVLMDAIAFYRMDTPQYPLWRGYVEDLAKLQLDDPIEGAIYRFCRGLIKEYRLSGQLPGSIWID